MTLRTRLVMVAGLLVASLGTAAVADSYRDCSKLKKWNRDTKYKRGDTVWYPGGMNKGVEYQCQKDTCHKDEPNTFAAGREAWKSLGNCKDKPPGV